MNKRSVTIYLIAIGILLALMLVGMFERSFSDSKRLPQNSMESEPWPMCRLKLRSGRAFPVRTRTLKSWNGCEANLNRRAGKFKSNQPNQWTSNPKSDGVPYR